LERHNKGYEKYTSKGLPWKLIFSKEYATRAEAMDRERKLKNLKSRKKIEEWIEKNRE
jgi:putative endonuclease